MRVKLRPDAHCAPVPQGVHWARGEHTFVLSGPPALYAVVDSQLDALLDGTSLDEMVTAAGDERARPVLEHVVRALVAKDVLIDLDAVEGPLPDQETAARHAELLCYLEANCVEPYRAFAAVRAARVAVAGGGPAAQAALRGLAANGTGGTTELRLPLTPVNSATATAVPAETAVVLIDDHDTPLDLSATAALLASGTPVVPVVAGAALAVVGPVCTSPEELRAFQAVQARAAGWQEAGTQSAAPRPLSAVLAGSLAAQVVLERLAGTDHGRRTAWVVHGHAVQTDVVPVPDAGPEPSWRAVDPTEVLVAALATADRVDTNEGGPVGADPTGGAGGDSESTDPARFHLDAAVTARWTGLARWGRDLDLPQLPINLVTAESAAGPHFLGWGTNRAAAGVTAGLSVLRHRAAQEPADEPGARWLPAAGLTAARWLADGLLRQAGQDEPARSAATSLAWEDLGSIVVRSQWSVLRDFFGVPAALRLHTVSGLDWQLVSATDELTGEVLATQWGPSRASAAYAALLAATARAQYRAAEPTAPPVLPPDVVGTWALEIVPEPRVHDCLRQLHARAEDMGLKPRARQLVRDEALGELPLTCGWVATG